MPRILVTCPSTGDAVATGYRTQDIDLSAQNQCRSFRCSCGQVHAWESNAAWAEEGMTESARRVYGLSDPAPPPRAPIGIN